MKTLFTKEFILQNCGCYSQEQALNILNAYKIDGTSKDDVKFIEKSEFTIDEILDFDVSLKDKAWFLRRNGQFSDNELREFAIGCALCVLPIYEAKYPANKAPREAIQAAKAYLAGTIGLTELREKRNAAYAAAAAAYAADAAAAADAAYAAADAAADAADAAYAAYAAAYADAAAKVDYGILLLNFFKDFVKTNCVVA